MAIVYRFTPKNQKFLSYALDIVGKLPVAIVYPLNEEAIKGAFLADQLGIISPFFIGPKGEMNALAKTSGHDLSNYECFDIKDPADAAQKAVDLAKQGQVRALFKGTLDTSILLKPVIAKEGLRGDRRISNCYICDVPDYHKPIIYTDVGINIAPDVKTKRDIIFNAITVAHSIGIKKPKIALLSCLEKVKETIPSTLDAKELTDIAKQGEFGDVIMEGPLSFDIAISKVIAEEKEFSSEIAGDPDILLFPNLDAGNIAVKQLEIFSHAQCGSLALGAKLPVLINSRNTHAEERALSCIFAKLYDAYHNPQK